VAATDAAMELLEQIQHDFGEGPHLQAYAQDQPVGTLDVYSTQPRAWTAHELEAMGEFASVAGELVQTSVQLASRELEVAQLQQALTSRVWTEQAKGVLAATRGTDPEVTFQQLRARARASSRRLAELAREVVQDAQRQRLASLALEDVRVQEADLAQRRRA
jgi:GAF domain-containing protein